MYNSKMVLILEVGFFKKLLLLFTQVIFLQHIFTVTPVVLRAITFTQAANNGTRLYTI